MLASFVNFLVMRIGSQWSSCANNHRSVVPSLICGPTTVCVSHTH